MGSRRFKNLIGAAAAFFSVATGAFADCTVDHVSLRGAFGEAKFDVAVADSIAERSRGLMFVESLDTMEGMLFVYGRPRSVSFWMRNTLIPLDMIFVDETGVVRNIHAMAQPLDETPIFGGEGIQFVLEINGGMAERLGLNAGDQMQHPSFGDDAIWTCDAN